MSVNAAGLCCAVALASACRDGDSTAKPPRPEATPGSIEVTEVACQDSTSPPNVTGGSYACEAALEKFLRQQGADEILSIIPIEAPPSALNDPYSVVRSGTQRLLVAHRAGGLHQARDLQVFSVPCTDGSKPITFEPDHCGMALRQQLQHFDVDMTAFWVPVTDYATDRHVPGTQHLLQVRWIPPRTATPPPASAE